MQSAVVLLCLLATAISAQGEKCNGNSDERCLRASPAAGVPFCRSWLSYSPVTVTEKGYITTATPRSSTEPELAPDCITTTNLSPYAKNLISIACSCQSYPLSTTTVAASTATK
ncbi:hypothetical protein B0O99DRAFT_400101 [Bisporella sp. PMI_857]|nr:hypothetical protein B0O99DRAFT_400101 [Bisporella sp. PMI_857]